MAKGPGKYDVVCTLARAMTGADGIVLIVLNGNQGQGFAVQGPPALEQHLPELLRGLADVIEKEHRDESGPPH